MAAPAAGDGGGGGGGEAYVIAGWIALMCVTQLAMFILAKRAMQRAKLPSLLCLAQFGLSALGTCAPSPLTGAGWRGLALMGREHCRFLLPLGIFWTVAFLALNASVALMSASLASTVRALEPVSTVILGFLAFGERYSLRLLATLLPICAGVALAAQKSGGAAASTVSAVGVLLAGASNFGFSSRPFLAQRLAAEPGVRKLDSASTFFNAMCIGVAVMVPAVAAFEAGDLREAAGRLAAEGSLGAFAAEVAASGGGFFFYQFSQMVLMSKLSAIACSVVNPMSKAFVIVACAVYFAEPMGAVNIGGVLLSAAGVVLFTLARRADAAAAAARAKAAGKGEKAE